MPHCHSLCNRCHFRHLVPAPLTCLVNPLYHYSL
jgi:hypothetical protein